MNSEKNTPNIQTQPGSNEHELAKKLWRSTLVKICQTLFIFPVAIPISHAIQKSGIQVGAIWVGLITVFFAYLGYKLGYKITKSICASDKITAKHKSAYIWALIPTVAFSYVLIFSFIAAEFRAFPLLILFLIFIMVIKAIIDHIFSKRSRAQ